MRVREQAGTSPVAHSGSLWSLAAWCSGFEDRRFPAIELDEVSQLSVSVSLLCHFEVVEDIYDWEARSSTQPTLRDTNAVTGGLMRHLCAQEGVHGIWMDWTDADGTHRNATYLPDVIPEQGWTKDEAIDSLLRKGGQRGTITREVKVRSRRHEAAAGWCLLLIMQRT